MKGTPSHGRSHPDQFRGRRQAHRLEGSVKKFGITPVRKQPKSKKR